MRQYRNSSATNWRKDTFVSPSPPTHHHSSSSRRRTANCDPCKTIERLTHSQFETNIPSLSSRILFAISATRIYTQSLTFDGGITMYASAKAMKRKQHSKPDTDFSNLQSCILDSRTHQRPFKL